MKGKYLITTDDWFFAPDGNNYKAVWGEVEVLGDDVLGIKTNARSSNWFAKVGSEDNHVIVAGCQIHYAVRCESPPNTSGYPMEETKDGKVEYLETRSRIYLAE